MRVVDPELIEQFGIKLSAGAIQVPLGPEGAEARALALLDRYPPKAVIACEKLGPNVYGEYAALDGQFPPTTVDHVSVHLFQDAARRGITTIGIGDAGNEVGLGVIEDVANLYNGPTPLRQGGYSTSIRSDVAVVATCSNWGAYAVSACISFLVKDLSAMLDAEMEGRVLAACAAKGAIDFIAGVPANRADGHAVDISQAIVTLLRATVARRLTDAPPSFLPREFTRRASEWADASDGLRQRIEQWL